MSLVLYRKYRPQSFTEVVGQDHIVKTLKGGIVGGKSSHAYLFTGPRGTGKTTVARILAKVLNCENPQKGDPCNNCNMCKLINKGEALDIIEIDAASNRGIDEIRALKEGIRFTPSVLKYKVFIIDEVHMLTKESFNALLKTLEEPPEHAIFILATTEIHKVLPTILSRCQRFDFRRLKFDELTGRLKRIAADEKIKIEDDALRFIGLSADGCMRDAESLLGQIVSLGDKKISLEDVQEILGVADMKMVFDFFESIFTRNYSQALLMADGLTDNGIDIQYFLQDSINHLRRLIFIKVYGDNKAARGVEEWTEEQRKRALGQSQCLRQEDLVSMLNLFVKALDDLRKFPLPQMALEVAALEAIELFSADGEHSADIELPNKKEAKETVSASNKDNKEKKLEINKKTKIKDSGKNNKRIEKEKSKSKKNSSAKKSKDKHRGLTLDEIIKHWDDIIKEVKPHNNSLFAFLGASLPQKFEDNILIIAAKYNFHKERLEERSNRLIAEEALEKVFDKKIKVKCILDKDLSLSKKIGEGAKDLVSSALKIFGGKVVE